MQMPDMVLAVLSLGALYAALSLLGAIFYDMEMAFLNREARRLEIGLQELFVEKKQNKFKDTPARYELLTAFYEHPLISCLYSNSYITPMERRFDQGRNLPSQIPASHFSLAVLDLVAERAKASTRPRFHADNLMTGAEAFGSAPIAKLLKLGVLTSGGDVNMVRVNLESWYDNVLNRVAALARYEARAIVFWVSLIVAVVLNVNAVLVGGFVFQHQTQNPPAAASDATPGPAVKLQVPPLGDQYNSGNSGAGALPVGWGEGTRGQLSKLFQPIHQRSSAAPTGSSLTSRLVAELGADGRDPADIMLSNMASMFSMIIGWIASAAAMTLGVRIWLGIIGQISGLRLSKLSKTMELPPSLKKLADALGDPGETVSAGTTLTAYQSKRTRNPPANK